jgi:hypothetical protein
MLEPHEREVVALRPFWNRAGKEIVSDVLGERGLLDWEDLKEE